MSRIVHFGADDLGRMQVLEYAGYGIQFCDSLPSLVTVLASGVDAVVFSDASCHPSGEELTAIRHCTSAPLILFQEQGGQCDLSLFDAVIPPLTPPELWLKRIAGLIAAAEKHCADGQADSAGQAAGVSLQEHRLSSMHARKLDCRRTDSAPTGGRSGPRSKPAA